MYHIASAAADTACSGTHDLKATTLTLHHVLRPGQPDTPSIEALLSPAAPYVRLCPYTFHLTRHVHATSVPLPQSTAIEPSSRVQM